MDSSRRTFVKSSLALGALSFLPFRFAWASPVANGALSAQARSALNTRTRRALGPNNAFSAHDPIQDIAPSQLFSLDFNGDDIDRTHEILWNVDGYVQKQGGIPAPSEDVSVVIVGGGMAGLVAAHELRDLNPLILDQDKVFGGNSKGERFGESTYSLGAAYITYPREGTDYERILKEIDLFKTGREEGGEDTSVFFEGRFAKGFWEGTTDPAARLEFEHVFNKLKEVFEKYEAEEPDEEWQMNLDRISFDQWLAETFGDLHPHLREYFHLYAWSSFAVSTDELSAYQMLGFIAAETASIMSFPGGNSAITSRLYQGLMEELGTDRLRARAMAIDVRTVGDHVHVTYVQADGSLKTIRAQACVFASPKFAAKRVIPELSAEQLKAMSEIRYRGYIVANVILDCNLPAPSYELYCLKGEVPPSPTAMHKSDRPFTDIVFGSWAQHDRTQNSMLTIYKAFAFDGDRQFLFHPDAHNKHKGRILEGIKPVLSALGIDSTAIKGVRMTRWGHSLPVAATGLTASGVLEKAHASIKDRIFFANQDNWANPCFETALDEAVLAAQSARSTLKQ